MQNDKNDWLQRGEVPLRSGYESADLDADIFLGHTARPPRCLDIGRIPIG